MRQDSNKNGTVMGPVNENLATRPVAGAARRLGGVSFLAPPTGVPDLRRARAQLAGVPIRRRERALFRAACLRRLEKAERAANYRGRSAVIGRVVAKLRAKYPGSAVSRNSLYVWSARFEEQGIMGLVERGGRRWRSARLVDEPAAMALPDLLDQTARLLGAVARRLRAAGRDRA